MTNASFVATKVCLPHMFVVTKYFCGNKYLSRQANTCLFLSQQKWYLWQLPTMRVKRISVLTRDGSVFHAEFWSEKLDSGINSAPSLPKHWHYRLFITFGYTGRQNLRLVMPACSIHLLFAFFCCLGFPKNWKQDQLICLLFLVLLFVSFWIGINFRFLKVDFCRCFVCFCLCACVNLLTTAQNDWWVSWGGGRWGEGA